MPGYHSRSDLGCVNRLISKERGVGGTKGGGGGGGRKHGYRNNERHRGGQSLDKWRKKLGRRRENVCDCIRRGGDVVVSGSQLEPVNMEKCWC